MNPTCTPHPLARTSLCLGALGALLLSASARADLQTDYVNATNATATSTLAGSLSVGGNLILAKPRATGGTVSYANGREIHTFLASGTLTFSAACTADCLVVAGGGGGARSSNTSGPGGGGGGGLVYTSLAVTAQSYAITVGAGGAGKTGSGGSGTVGENSVFSTITAYGGGAGGFNAVGGNGGSGGGGGNGSAGGNADYISPRQGYDGGSSVVNTGGGGGGAGEVGGNATTGAGGAGGDGFVCSISGSNFCYAGGGGGGGSTCGTGGQGGGGDASRTTVGKAGTSGLGGGGGAGWYSQNGGNGGSGIVIISLPADSSYIDVASTVSTLKNNLGSTSNALNSAIIAAQVGTVPTGRTISVNGAIGTLTSNLSFTVATGVGNVVSVFGRTNVVAATTGDYTAEQVGAVATNDARYLAALTNAAAFDAVGVAASVQTNLVSASNALNTAISAEATTRAAADTSNAAAAASAQTSATNALAVANFKLSPTGNGASLTNITASQVGAVATNNIRYLAALTNAAAFDAAGAAVTVQTNLVNTSNALISAIAAEAVTRVAVDATNASAAASAQTTATNALAVANSKLSTSGDGSGLNGITATQVGADPAGAAATVQTNLNHAANGIYQTVLSTTTNVLYQALLNIGPYGGLSMGSYTNRAQ